MNGISWFGLQNTEFTVCGPFTSSPDRCMYCKREWVFRSCNPCNWIGRLNLYTWAMLVWHVIWNVFWNFKLWQTIQTKRVLTPKGSASNPTNKHIREERKVKREQADVLLRKAAVHRKVEEVMLQKKIQVAALPDGEDLQNKSRWIYLAGRVSRNNLPAKYFIEVSDFPVWWSYALPEFFYSIQWSQSISPKRQFIIEPLNLRIWKVGSSGTLLPTLYFFKVQAVATSYGPPELQKSKINFAFWPPSLLLSAFFEPH